MWTYWRLFRGMVRRGWIITQVSAIESKTLMGYGFRFWAWLNKYPEDEEVAKNPEKIPWKYKISEIVQIGHNRNCVGMIWWRFCRFGQKLYEVKINKRYYCFYEWELKKTKAVVRSKIQIKELKFRKLSEGHRCLPTKRFTYPTYPIHPMYSDRYANLANRW